MALSDPLGDMLTRIRNGQHARKPVIESPHSNFRARVLDVLKDEGYIRGYSESEQRKGIRTIQIELKYHEGLPAIQELVRVSTPGRRVYSGIKELGRVQNGLGISILSTPKGVMSDAKARAEHVGGEILCRVF
jgi:small subunit ribosomal protein S8